MGFWTKKEHTHIDRNENRQITRITRSGDIKEGQIGPLQEDTKSLIRHYKGSHPGLWQNIKSDLQERAWDARGQRNREKTAYKDAYQEGRVKRATKQGFSRGFGQINRPIPRRPQRQATKIVYVKQHKKRSTYKTRAPEFVFDPWKGHLVRR